MNRRYGNRNRSAIPAFALSVLLVAVGLFAAMTRFVVKGNYEGLFLLKGRNGNLFELKDDLYLGDGSRLLAGLDFAWMSDLLPKGHAHEPGQPYLVYKWQEISGTGYIFNHMGDGSILFTSLSRYVDTDGAETYGLFVGGGLPRSVRDDDVLKMNETGMAFYNGKRWFHLWCNMNEGIASAENLDRVISPVKWKYLGSRSLNRSTGKLAVASFHEVTLDGVPLRIDRYAYFVAGDIFFRLEIEITNVGDRPVTYYYLFGDEPWLGDFGTSEGNVGWVRDRIIRHETVIDPKKYAFAGMYDCGNSLVDPPIRYTGAANFIEWLGPNRPDVVYFSNAPEAINPGDVSMVPLQGNSRFLGLMWRDRVIGPKQTQAIHLAIGMAEPIPGSPLPVKPDVPNGNPAH